MLNWFRKFTSNTDTNLINEQILNNGLTLALEWGENWLKPIGPRLKEKYPNLSEEQLDLYNKICQQAMRSAQDLVYTMAESVGRHNLKYEEWESIIKTAYPWISQENRSHLFSQGMYYAWKDGVSE